MNTVPAAWTPSCHSTSPIEAKRRVEAHHHTFSHLPHHHHPLSHLTTPVTESLACFLTSAVPVPTPSSLSHACFTFLKLPPTRADQ